MKRRYRQANSIGFVPKGHISRKLKALIITVCITSLFIGAFIGYTMAATSSSTFYISSGQYPGAATYTLWKEASNYFAKDAYGLIKYSGTNFSKVLQQCVDSVSEGLIHVSRGDYYVSATVSLKGHMTLQGDGMYATVFWLSNGANCDMFKWAPSSDDGFLILRDFRIEGNKQNNNAGRGVVLSMANGGRCWDLQVQGVWIIRCKGDNFYTENLWGHKYRTLICEESDAYGFRCAELGTSGYFSGCRFSNNLGGVLLWGRKTSMVGCEFDSNNRTGLDLNGTENTIIGGYVIGNSEETAGSWGGINVKGSYNTITAVYFRGESKENYGISIEAGYYNNTVVSCVFWDDYTTAPFNSAGTDTIFRHNIGWVTENSGNATISASTFVDVTHGIIATPTNVRVTPQADINGDFWISNVGDTTFRINVDGSQTVSFYWYAEYLYP